MRKFNLAIILMLLFLAVPNARSYANQPGIEPVLMLDTGGHMAKIGKIIAMRDERRIISASNDKTIRIWDTETGQETAKILGQIGGGPEGMIYAIALIPDKLAPASSKQGSIRGQAPDKLAPESSNQGSLSPSVPIGEWLAVGGLFNDPNGVVIRIYDLNTGALIKVLKSHANVVYDLSVSKDRRYLVSGSGDTTVKVWDIANNFSLVHTFEGHTNDVYAVRILRSGGDYNPLTPFDKGDYRIVSAGFDNKAILWSLNDKKILNSYTHSDKLGFLAVSDSYIAVSGYGNKINIFDHNLKGIKEIVSETVPLGLSFSPDGRLLLAGRGTTPNNCNIYDSQKGFEQITSFKKHDNLTMAVTFLNNRTAVTGGGANYDIYLWDAYTGEVKRHISGNGKRVWSVGIRGLPSNASIGGREIAFGNMWTETKGKSQLEKSINLETFVVSELTRSEGFKRIDTGYQGYSLTYTSGGDYGCQDAVLLIKKDGKETGRITRGATDGYRHNTYGFTGDGAIISGGTSGFLTAYNKEGQKTASFIGHVGAVLGIAIDGDTLVSGSDDQTIMLWNLQELKEGKNAIYPMLNIFVSKDDEWVVWSNKGYYNASVGGDKYIGYHINQGPDKEAMFYSVDKFSKTYYRPDIIKNIIRLGSEEKALEYVKSEKKVEEVRVAEILPPLIRLNKPESTSLTTTNDSIAVDFTVIPQSKHGITETAILVNGRPIGDRGMEVTPKDGVIRVVKDVPLYEQFNRISLIARNQYASSEEVMIEVEKKAKASGDTKVSGDMYKPSLYILAIGVSQYQNKDLNLKYAADDARALVKMFKGQEGRLFKTVKYKLFRNAETTRDTILDGIDWLDKEATQRDVVVLFIAGHGVNDDKDNYYFLSHEANLDKLRSTAVRWTDFEDIVTTLPSKTILLADTCHAGGIMGKRRMIDNNITKAIKELMSSGRGQVIMTASTGGSASFEEDAWGHGAFTKAILEGLGELKADFDKNDVITVKEIDLYVTGRVKELTSGRQKPTTIIPESVPDFPIVSR